MNKEKNQLLQIRKDVIEDMEDKLNERLLYIIPYEKFYISNSTIKNEVAVKLENIYFIAKEFINKYGQTDKKVELYNDNNKIAETDENHRLRYDREITEELIKLKNDIKKENEKNGTNYEVAGINKNGDLETYIEFINRKAVALNRKEKEQYEKSKLDKKEHEKEKQKIEQKSINNKENNEQMKELLSDDLEIKKEDINQITPIQDDLFYDNNLNVARNMAMVIQLRSGELEVVSDNGRGKYEKSAEFGKSTNESGRTNIITNNNNKIEEKNTYGALYSNQNKDMRYVITYGEYGEIKLLEQRKVTQNLSGQMMTQNDLWMPSREVQTSNTNYLDINREGISRSNTTRNMYNRRTNENRYINEEANRIVNSKNEAFTVEDITDENDVRIEKAVNQVKEKLNREGLILTEDDEQNIKLNIINDITQNDEVYSEEQVNKFCENFKANKEKQQEVNKVEERTLAGDALNRRARNFNKK